MRFRVIGAAACFWLVGCAGVTRVPDADRLRVVDELEGARRYLKISCFIAPLFSDTDRRILLPSHPEETRLLETPGGEPILPPTPEGIVPAGRRARIESVEFPTPAAMAARTLRSPRFSPWVYVDLEGDEDRRPLVLVLRGDLRSADEVIAEVERFLTPHDPGPRLSAYSEEVRRAIGEKRLLLGMDDAAVEMAWGYPYLRRIDYREGSREEEWTYPSETRRAHLVDGRLVRFEP